LSAEYIVSANPKMIFLADTISGKASTSSVAKRPGFSKVAAVEDHEVIGLNDDIASRWGPRLSLLMNQITAAVKGALKNPSSGSKPLSSNPPTTRRVPSSRPLRSWRSSSRSCADWSSVRRRSPRGEWSRHIRARGNWSQHAHANTVDRRLDAASTRMVIGLLAGSMLAVAGGTYQGVFEIRWRSVSTGVASGAGLGATFAIIDLSHGVGTPSWTPLLAFVGAMAAVTLTWLIGGRSMRSNTATLILAGVAVASLLTSAQTFLQQQSSAGSITRSTSGYWITGECRVGHGLVVFPYVIVCIMICVGAGRALDVMSVGEDESRSLGVPVRRVRFIVIAASSLGTAAIVSAVGLIGFVGIIVPTSFDSSSYVVRRILPIS